MALSDLKQVILTKQELLVLEELLADYSNRGERYSFRISDDVVHTEDEMEVLYDKLQNARFS